MDTQYLAIQGLTLNPLLIRRFYNEPPTPPHRHTAAPPHRHNFVKKLSLVSLFAATLTIACAAQAHERGDFMVRLGLSAASVQTDFSDGLAPEVASALGVPSSTIGLDFKNDTRPTLDFTYILLDKLGIDVMLSTAYKHDIRGSYSGNDQELAAELADVRNVYELEQHPFAIGSTFYPRGNKAVRVHPYLGAGAVYTRVKLNLHGDAAAWLRAHD